MGDRISFTRGAAIIHGQQFDFAKLLKTYEEVIDIFSKQFSGDEEVLVSTTHRQFSWNLPWFTNKDELKDIWSKIAMHYEVVDEALVHAIGPLTIKVFLFGKTWCVFDTQRNVLLTPAHEDIALLDVRPVICIYGKQKDVNKYGLVDAVTMMAVKDVIDHELAPFQFSFVRDGPYFNHGDHLHELFFGRLFFPHEVYGNGRGPIRVCCVDSDGNPVETMTITNSQKKNSVKS